MRSERRGSALVFHCPGCECLHAVTVEQLEGGRKPWGWNGKVDYPTITPSILVHANPVTPDCVPGYTGSPRCHSFVRDGRIQFLDDCTHALKGQTVDLPEWEP